MIRVEYTDGNILTGGIIDAGTKISMEGEVPILAIELANLLTAVSDKYPIVMDLALKYVEDNNEIRREELRNDKTDKYNN